MSEQTSVVDSFSWKSLRQTAEAHLEGNKVTPPKVEIPKADDTKAANAADEPVIKTVEHNVGTGTTTKTDKSEEPVKPTESKAEAKTPVEISDDTLVKWKVDGEDVIIPYGEARLHGMRASKFTKEMQALRAKEGTLTASEAEIQKTREERDQLAALVGDKKLLGEYIKEVYPDLTAAERREVVKEVQAADVLGDKFDPEEIATLGQAKDLILKLNASHAAKVADLEAKVANVDRLVEEKLTKFNKEADRASSITAINTLIDTTIDQMVKDIPLLRAVPHIKASFREDLKKLKSRNVEELKENLATVAKGYVEDIEEVVTSTNKQKVVQKQKLDTKTIEPSGGSPVTQKPISAKDVKTADGGIDWKKLRELALSK